MISINSYVDNFRGSFEDRIKEDSKKIYRDFVMIIMSELVED